MKIYDSVVSVPEMSNPKWLNFIEGVVKEGIEILRLLIQIDSSLLIEKTDSLQKLHKRVIKKQRGFSYLSFLGLCLQFKSLILFELETLFR